MTYATSDHWPLKDGLRIGHLNINHLINKMSDASHIVHNSKPYGRGFHIFCFSESRLNNHMDDKDIAIEGFHVIRKDPQIQRETGLVVYVHETMSVTRLTEFERYGVECIWLEVKLQKTSPFLVGFLYRNPSEPANWTDKFVSMMDVVWLESKEIILMGDFNIDLSKTNKPWTDVFSLFNLSQTVSSPTRVTPSSKTLNNHIYSTDIAHILETCVPVIGVSDHYPICCTWSKKGVKIPKVGHSHLTYRSFARFDESEFLNDLNNAPFDKVYNHTDPDEALATWYSVFLKVLDKHAPQKKRRIKYSFKPGWLTLEVLDAMRYRDYLLKLKLFDEYKKQRNKVIYMIRNTQKTLFC